VPTALNVNLALRFSELILDFTSLVSGAAGGTCAN
jgi:hypothetical protein